jgi:hypothetical protein
MAERPTLHSIGVCALIALHSDPTSPLHEIEFKPHEQDGLTSFLEESVFGSRPTNDLSPWLHQLRQRIGPDVATLLEETLTMAADSVDSLVDLMESLRVAVADGVVDAVSAHGVFLRQICLGFDELSFESVALFWQDLKRQLDCYCFNDFDNSDSSNVNVNVDSQPSWPLSTEQTERRLQEDCLQLAFGSGGGETETETETGQSFEAIELRIRKILESNPELPAAYFLRFLNCLRHGERAGALDALHLYFDHAMVKHSSPKDILQFSAILLAMTHHSFGDKRLALAATDEAVRVAQQSKDAACVAFALGWLFENSGYGNAERRELLKRCAKRASQGQIRSLVTGANLALAKNYLEDTRRTPSASWTSLMEVTAEQAADNLTSLDRPTLLTQVPEDAMESLARQRLVSAGIWDSFGMPALSGLSSTSALNSREHLSSADIVAAIQNISRLALYGSAANIDLERKDEHPAGVDKPCIYSVAISRMVLLRNRLGLNGKGHDDFFFQNMALILHEWAVNRGDLADASALETVFNSYVHPGIENYDQFLVDTGLQSCLLRCRESNWEEARNIATRLCHICETKGLKIHQARVCVQLAMIQLESNPKQFMAALPPLLQALSLAEKSEVYGLHAAALTILAKVFLRLKNPMRALGILKAAVPTLLEREHIWFQGEAFLIESKCHFEVGSEKKESKLNKRRLKTALNSLKRSQELFQRCQDFFRLREVFYLQARIHSVLEQPAEREVAAQRFIDISAYLETHGKVVSSSILDSLQDDARLNTLVGRPVEVAS